MRSTIALLLALPLFHAANGEPAAEPSRGAGSGASTEPAPAPVERTPALEAAMARLQLPGVKINVEQWCVDVTASVALREGLLELIACTKDSKEHESIFVVEAKPSHIHTALLLLGAKAGSPASHRALDAEQTRFLPVPPHGGPVEVFVLIKDPAGKETEHPVSDFIERADRGDGDVNARAGDAGKFPKRPFLFAGSVLIEASEGPRQYLCDQTGNVISLATFGDELLCLPDIEDHANGALMWQVAGDKLPEPGGKVILRLRPQVKPRNIPEPGGKPPAK